MIFLGQENPIILKWPEVDASNLVWILLIFLIFGLVFYLVNQRYKLKIRLDEAYQHFLQIFLHRRPNETEIQFIRSYWEGLHTKIKLSSESDGQDALHYKNMILYFDQYNKLKEDDKKKSFFKLFHRTHLNEPIRETKDITPDEICILTIAGKHHYTSVKKIYESRVLLDLRKNDQNLTTGQDAIVEFFRYGSGVFQFGGKTEKVTQDTILILLEEGVHKEAMILDIEAREKRHNPLTMIQDENRGGVPEPMKKSMEKILNYSSIKQEKKEIFINLLDHFKSLSNLNFNSEELKKDYHDFLEIYYEIYESVFRRMYNEKSHEKILYLFINFGFMDETVLTPEQCQSLLSLADLKHENENGIYSAFDWLSAIYKKLRYPSINETKQNLKEILHTKVVKTQMTEEDAMKYEEMADARIRFEIRNLFRSGKKMCYSSHFYSFFPIIHRGLFDKQISDMVFTSEKIKNYMKDLIAVDFSVFHREIFWDQTEKSSHEKIQIQVLPEIILLPGIGGQGMLWQELTGDKKSSSRIIIPAMTSEDGYKLIIHWAAQLRWEIAKNLAGKTWSDISMPTLPGEYTYFLENAARSRLLSAKAKEILKQLEKKFHNDAREIFAFDYMNYILNESKGMMRLAPQTREILFRFCPFSRSIRETLKKHPLYQKEIEKFHTQKINKIRVLEARYHKYFEENKMLPAEWKETLNYYKYQ